MSAVHKKPGDRARLTQLMEDRRLELGRTWTEVAQMGKITTETLRQARGDGNIAPLTLVAIDDGLDWTRGSARAILAGGEPTPRPAADPVRAATQDADAVNLPPNDQDFHEMPLDQLQEIRDRIMAEIDRRASLTEPT